MNADTTLWFCNLVIALVDIVVVLAIVLPIGGLLASLAMLVLPPKSRPVVSAAPVDFSSTAVALAKVAI